MSRLIVTASVLTLMVFLAGCSRATWTRADLFSTKEAVRSQQQIAATVESVVFLGGVQRGLNLLLDEPVATDQGTTKHIYLEQPVQLPTGIVLMKRVLVHFDFAGSPLFISEIKPPSP